MPWLTDAWSRLAERWLSGRLPHAILLEGPDGIGKSVFARELAQRLVCEGAGEAIQACGHCKQCELVAAGTHPDIRTYQPEDSKVIKVDQVRALGEFAVASPQVAHHKVIILDSADQLNINAANALLKTLEEPNRDVTLILLQQSGRPLLPTIRSRCQSVLLAGPTLEQAQAWLGTQAALEESPADAETQARALRLASGAPIRALAFLAQGHVEAVDQCLENFRQFLKSKLPPEDAARPFVKLGLETTLGLMERWAADLARISVGGAPENPEVADILGYLTRQNPPHRAHGILAHIAEVRAGLTYNLNAELETERLLLHWLDLMPRRRAG
ncbi:DNA polymerase III subunit delta' [Marinobacter halodurans]|uniref:DNA-directed DNA polymerase n=2 Tax=Marinobacter halodurans TaxID=2528979 RepID=A0ABY1ZND8_9GAMM|nr:DNA polymerase III subunit delta' [Marinobacter halodurans]TBW54795.1 DNA polymerase III subunit delta' [Marinobacter halodurans]